MSGISQLFLAPFGGTVSKQPPNVPTNLTITGGPAISASAAAGAQSYTLNRSIHGADSYTAVVTGAASFPIYDSTWVPDGNDYDYTITAVNSAGSTTSMEVVTLRCYAYDAFVQANGTNLNGQSLSGANYYGQGPNAPTWSTQAGTAEVESHAFVGSTTAATAMAAQQQHAENETTGVPAADGMVSVLISVPNATSFAGGLFLRWASNSPAEYLTVLVQRDSGGTPYVQIYENLAAGSGSRAKVNVAGLTLGASHALTAVLLGSTIFVLLDGVPLANCSYGSLVNTSSAFHGPYSYHDSSYTVAPITAFSIAQAMGPAFGLPTALFTGANNVAGHDGTGDFGYGCSLGLANASAFQLGSNQFYLWAWIKIDGTGGYTGENGIFSKLLLHSNEATYEWVFSKVSDNSGGYLTFGWTPDGVAVDGILATNFGQYPYGETWHFVEVKYDGTNLSIRVDNNNSYLNQTNTYSGTETVSPSPDLRIGCWGVDPNPTFLTGQICGLGLLNGRVPTSGEQAAIWNNGNGCGQFSDLPSSIATDPDLAFFLECMNNGTFFNAVTGSQLTNLSTLTPAVYVTNGFFKSSS